jgi:phosphoribosylformylglycinamidine synthase
VTSEQKIVNSEQAEEHVELVFIHRSLFIRSFMAELYEELGLTKEEYDKIVKILGREPTYVELAMYSVMWSEHCSYKSSKPQLKNFPTTGPAILQGPGENAGIIDIGDGQAIAMKIESHNHPSAIEPYQGAATGVGGILRDIFTMGARPIAVLDPLRFGSLEDDRVKYLFEEVVAGIAGYGNCVGVPTIAGDVYFEECYEGNPLVNVMAVGLVETDKIMHGYASGPGNSVILFGNKTGRDGIGGVSVLASQEFTETAQEKRPSVQVGDPFTEKLLIEVSLELIEKRLLVGLQDLGGAGLTCAACETSSRAETGMEIDIANVIKRETGMEPFETMVSESQERMLGIATPENTKNVLDVCKKWGVDAMVIGKVTDDGALKVYDDGELVGEMPSRSLADEAPVYHRTSAKPDYIKEIQSFDPRSLKTPRDIEKAFMDILTSPNICSKRWVYEQYDHMVQTNTALIPGGDAGVLRIKETQKAIALTVDGNGRYCYLDPYTGSLIAMAEAARNLVATGARPLAITDCLNFGNPEKPHVFWQFTESVRALTEACRVFNTPVVGGNVSFYNEWKKGAVYPTPVVGMLGLIKDIKNMTTIGFKRRDDIVALLGNTMPELGGSEYLKVVRKKVAGRPPAVDLKKEKALQECCLEAIEAGLIKSAHDISEGGLAVILAECCIAGKTGAVINGREDTDMELYEWLFSESQGRIVISFKERSLFLLEKLCSRLRVDLTVLGRVGGENLQIGDKINISVERLKNSWQGALHV